jgi:hypothetical protein
MNDANGIDTLHLDEEVERELAAYASARLSPDRLASNRMRVAVIEHGRTRAAAAGGHHALDVLAPFRLRLRRLAPVALVAAIAITGGTTAAVAASPGGPLYGVRLQIETALLPASGSARTDAQIGLLDERADEITNAVDDGNSAGTDAAANAYGDQVDQTIDGTGAGTDVAAQRGALLDLRATLEKQLAHFQSIVKPNDKSAGNLQSLIAKTQAAIATVDAKLAALGN